MFLRHPIPESLIYGARCEAQEAAAALRGCLEAAEALESRLTTLAQLAGRHEEADAADDAASALSLIGDDLRAAIKRLEGTRDEDLERELLSDRDAAIAESRRAF